MDLKDIRDDLQDFLRNGWNNRHTRYAELGRLVDALEKKETNLEKRLDMERDPLKRRHLKIELKVTRVQRAKGIRRLRELQPERTPSHIPSHGSTIVNVTD